VSGPFEPIVLRLFRPRVLIAPVIAFVGALLGIAFATTHFDIRALFLSVLLVGSAANAVLVLRARTEIGPDGIRNRAIREEVFIPWDDIEGVVILRANPARIQIFRASDHRRVNLAAAREGLDELAALIADRAGLPELSNFWEPDKLGEPHDLAGWQEAPLSLRPSRRPLWWMLTVAIALPASFAANAAGVTEAPLLPFLLPLSVVLAVQALRLVRGRTDVGPEGITNRLIVKRKFLAWEEIVDLAVVATLFGRVARVRGVSGKKLRLAAPRDGLLDRNSGFDATLERLRAATLVKRVTDPPRAMATRTGYAVSLAVLLVLSVVFWGPWLEPWWPTLHEARSVPKACDAVDPATLTRLVPGGPPVPGAMINDDKRGYVFTACAWVQSGAAANGSIWVDSLEVYLTLDRHTPGGDSGTGAARAEMARTTRGATPIGGGAWLSVLSTHDAKIQLRRANAIIVVDYQADNRSDTVTQAEALARAIATKINIS
jgi:hypothetical protein